MVCVRACRGGIGIPESPNLLRSSNLLRVQLLSLELGLTASESAIAAAYFYFSSDDCYGRNIGSIG